MSKSAGPPQTPSIAARKHDHGIRTRGLLIFATTAIITGATLVSMLAIRRPLQNLVTQNLSSDLLHSLATFESMQHQRKVDLDRENALVADLPSLKALMTTSDERTISDGGVEFWKVSGTDLFALADRDRNIKAAYLRGTVADSDFRSDLSQFISGRGTAFLISRGGLYVCSVQPLYFGTAAEGTLLGYVVSGFAVDNSGIQDLTRATDVEAVFLSGRRKLAGSLGTRRDQWIDDLVTSSPPGTSQPFKVTLGREHFLAVSHDLSAQSSAPLVLVELKSLDQEELAIREIDRLVLLAGLLALVVGIALMVALSRSVTLPLEQLATGVRAFAVGDSTHILPCRGTREIKELSDAFARMRREIVQANQALLESERLATIGRMASSVSHDLRHYLAAVYANSEFLASDRLSDADRTEVLAEIRTAVEGTTEMLESLLMFSRTGTGLGRTPQSITALAERALNMVKAHPDAANVAFSFSSCEPSATEAIVDAKQVERAIYNLLLNGCQAPHPPHASASVAVSVLARGGLIEIDVVDNGDGVPSNIRYTIFDPFVSEGKQKGSGLGLTLTQSIAAEHGGSVALISSRPGETVFRITIARSGRAANHVLASGADKVER